MLSVGRRQLHLGLLMQLSSEESFFLAVFKGKDGEEELEC